MKVINAAAPEVVKAVDTATGRRFGRGATGRRAVEFQRRVVKKLTNGEAPTSADAVRQARREDLKNSLNSIAALEAKAIAGTYDVIVCDPPWEYDKIERDTRPEQVSWGFPTMSVDEIADEVGEHLRGHLAENAHFFLWATQKYLPLAFSLLDRWSLAYAETFVWHKDGGFQPFDRPQFNCEFVIHARKGSPPKFLTPKIFFTASTRIARSTATNQESSTQRCSARNWWCAGSTCSTDARLMGSMDGAKRRRLTTPPRRLLQETLGTDGAPIPSRVDDLPTAKTKSSTRSSKASGLGACSTRYGFIPMARSSTVGTARGPARSRASSRGIRRGAARARSRTSSSAQNFERRHLNATDRALAALKAEPFYAAEAKQRQLAALKKGQQPVPVSQKVDYRGERVEVRWARGQSGQDESPVRRGVEACQEGSTRHLREDRGW